MDQEEKQYNRFKLNSISEFYYSNQHPCCIQQIFDKIFKIDFLQMVIQKGKALDCDQYIDWWFSIKDEKKKQIIEQIDSVLNYDNDKEVDLIDIFLRNIVYFLEDKLVLLNKHTFTNKGHIADYQNSNTELVLPD